MTADIRSRLLRYAIATDLVVIATGLTLFFPSEPIVLLSVFVAAVAIAAWKSGWQAAMLSIVLSTVSLLVLFGGSFDASHVIAFVVDSGIVTAIMAAAVPHRARRAGSRQDSTFGKLVAVDPLDPSERDRESNQRREVARSLERAAAAQLKEQRDATERAADGANVTRLTPKRGKSDDRSTRR